jgi:hypothetical protein
MLTTMLFLFALTSTQPAATGSPAGVEPIAKLAKTSFIVLPKTVGRFHLTASKKDQGSGSVIANFTYAGAPKGLEITVTVSPVGRVDEKRAATAGATTLHNWVARNKDFSSLQASEQLPAGIDWNPSYVDPDDPDFVIQDPGHGVHESFVFRANDQQQILISTSAYHYLHVLRIDVRGSRSLLPDDRWQPLAEEAADKLLPAIDILNVGACGYFPASAPSPKEGRRARLESCVAKVSELPSTTDTRYTIDH